MKPDRCLIKLCIYLKIFENKENKIKDIMVIYTDDDFWMQHQIKSANDALVQTELHKLPCVNEIFVLIYHQ